MPRCLRWAAVTLVLLVGMAACGDDNRPDIAQDVEQLVDDARREAGEAAGEVEAAGGRAGARAVAEAVRAALVVEQLRAGGNLRDVDVLRRAVGNVPGEPQVTGIEDTDGDGRDDDGRIEVAGAGERACLTVPDQGKDVNVENGPC